MPSKTEQILIALLSALRTIPDVTVERNSAVPEKIPSAGLIIFRDGIADEPEQALGGFGGIYCRQDTEIEIYVENGDAAARDAAFDTLLQKIGTVLDADPTLGGLAFGLTYSRPEIDSEAVIGGPAIKAGTLIVAVEFEADTALG
ncbi:MAG: acyl-CoA transferase [Terasakiella sp.]|uniref:acyl-CoA transferase n=1 Tax=unclassified Terasakiella TaxID=2614952 RepID=UPI003AFFE257